MKNDHNRFTIQFAHSQLPGPRPAVVIEEIRSLPKFSGKPVGNGEPGVGTDQLTHSIPVASIKVIHIKLHNPLQLRVRTASRLRWGR